MRNTRNYTKLTYMKIHENIRNYKKIQETIQTNTRKYKKMYISEHLIGCISFMYGFCISFTQVAIGLSYRGF